MVVDDEHEQIFVAAGDSSSSLSVLDFSGHLQGQLKNLPFVSGMVVDGANLYVAVSGDDSIAVIDTETLRETGRYSVHPYTHPNELALAGGRLWFAGADRCVGDSPIASMDLATKQVRGYDVDGFRAVYCPELSTTPSSNLLAISEPDAPRLNIYDVSGEPRQVFFRTGLRPGVLLPDGNRVLTADDYSPQLVEISSGAQQTSYAVRFSAFVYTVSPDGRFVGVIRDGDPGYPVVYVFDTESSVLTGRYRIQDCLAPWGLPVEARTLAFSGDGRKLFVITKEAYQSGPDAEAQLHLFPTALKPANLKLSATKKTIRFGSRVRFAARLSSFGASANDRVTLYARELRPSAFDLVSIGSGVIDHDGFVRVKEKLPSNSVVWAQWTGDPGSHACASSRRIDVNVRMAVSGSLVMASGSDGSVKLYRSGDPVRYVSHVRPSHESQLLNVVVQRRSGHGWKSVQEGVVVADERETFKISGAKPGPLYRVGGNTDADVDHLGGRSPWRYFRVVR
jgi:YVTN family beta-propeller protein